mgnify:CR=1 FL=1
MNSISTENKYGKCQYSHEGIQYLAEIDFVFLFGEQEI